MAGDDSDYCASKMNDDIKTVTVTVTEALVLRLLLEDRGRITESICILVPADRMKLTFLT